MSDKNCSNDATRRKFLKGTYITTGYVPPVVMAIQLDSLDAWIKKFALSLRNPVNHNCQDKKKHKYN